MARFYHWSPSDIDNLTGTELLEWCDAANDMLARERDARLKAQANRGR